MNCIVLKSSWEKPACLRRLNRAPCQAWTCKFSLLTHASLLTYQLYSMDHNEILLFVVVIEAFDARPPSDTMSWYWVYCCNDYQNSCFVMKSDEVTSLDRIQFPSIRLQTLQELRSRISILVWTAGAYMSITATKKTTFPLQVCPNGL